MMDVFYIEFRKKDELTTDDSLVDGVAVLKNITGAPTSKFSSSPISNFYRIIDTISSISAVSIKHIKPF